jgi:hypothetical protein
MTYQLPEPTKHYIGTTALAGDFYSADKVLAAYEAGRASRDEEVAKLQTQVEQANTPFVNGKRFLRDGTLVYENYAAYCDI